MSERVAVIYNPINRSTVRHGLPDLRERIRQAFRSNGVRLFWYETSKADPGYGCTRHAAARGVDAVVVAGGDGTVMACASALVGVRLPLAIVPSGTGNVIAANLGVPTDLNDAVRVALHGQRRRIDVGTSAAGSVFYAVSIGLTAAMMREATPVMKARLGMLAYALSAGRHLLDPPRKYSIWLDDEPAIVRSSHGVIVGNLGQVIVGPQFLPTALDDGLLEVGVLRIRPVLDWLRRDRPNAPAQRWPPLDWYQARKIRVACDQPVPTERDGDWVGPASQIELQVLPRSLLVCAPDPAPTPVPRQSLPSLLTRDVRKLRPKDLIPTPSRLGRGGRRSPV